MTTIAYRDGIIAGDGRETDIEDDENSMIISDSTTKVHRLKDGRLFGAAGTSEQIIRLLGALQFGGALPTLTDVSALLIDKRKISLYEGHLWIPIPQSYYAVGSGGRFAFPAMDAGASAVEAVKIAMKRDPFSGGKLTVLRSRK